MLEFVEEKSSGKKTNDAKVVRGQCLTEEIDNHIVRIEKKAKDCECYSSNSISYSET